MKKFYFIILSLFFIFIFYFDIEFKNLSTLQKKKFFNFNFQGIECIDDKIYLISNFDHKIYELTDNFKLKLFLKTDLIIEKKDSNLIPFVHITSFYIKNNIFYAVQSFDKLPGYMVISDLNSVNKNRELKESNYSIKKLDGFSNHIEYENNKEYLFLNSYSNYTKKSNFNFKINNRLQCNFFHNFRMQNMFIDIFNKNLLIINNLFFYKFGVIAHIPIKYLCDSLLPNKIEIIINPYYELEGFTRCAGKDFYVFINKDNSYIYIN